MSQTSFLEDVINWDEQRCRSRIDEALPKLISSFETSKSLDEDVGVLKILCHMFLPCIQTEITERALFTKITDKVCGIADNILDNIKRNAVQQDSIGLEENLVGLLQQLIEVLDCCEKCLTFLCRNDNRLGSDKIQFVPVLTVSLLKSTYSHCKESGDIYKELITCVSESLSHLFKKAHSLQILLLTVLDKLVLDAKVTDEDIESLCVVYHGLFTICQIVSALDIKLIVSLWKFLSKSCVEYKEYIQNRLDVDPMIKYLCDEVGSGYEYLFHLVPRLDKDDMILSQGDEKGFQKNLKIVSFQLKILVTFVKEYREYLCESERNVWGILTHLHRCLSPCLKAPKIPEKYTEEMKRQLLSSSEPLLHHLSNNCQFYLCLNQINTDDDWFPRLMLLLNIVDVLPKLSYDIQEKYLSPTDGLNKSFTSNVVSSVFDCISKCFIELSIPVMLPGLMCSGKPLRQVSLYEYVCTHICGFVGSCPADFFHVLEETLLQNVISENFYCSQLATDVWSYLVRYGSAELCYRHCCIVADVCSTCIYPVSLKESNLFLTLKRLVKFLSSYHQELFCQTYPVRENLVLWSEIPIMSFPSSIRKELTKTIHTYCMECLQTLSDTLFNTPDGWTVVNCLKCLIQVYQQPDIEEIYGIEKLAVSLDKHLNLWLSLFDIRSQDLLYLTIMSHYIKFISCIVHLLQITDLLKIVQQLILLMGEEKKQDGILKLSTLCIMKELGKVKFQPCFEQTQLLQKLPLLFSYLLQDSNPVIHHKALETFTCFAEDTVHESIVSECMNVNSHLQDTIIAFINKEYTPVNKEEYLFEQKALLDKQDINEVTGESEENEPSSKRARIESKTEQISVSLLLSQMEPLLFKLEEMSLTEKLNKDECDRLKSTYNRLGSIVDKYS